jgi:hypothetical protein
MGKQPAKKPASTSDKFFVFGTDDKGKPRGARFAEFNERALNFAVDLMLTGVYPASAAFTEIAAKLPPGRLYSSGKAFVPNIRRDLVEQLEARLAARATKVKSLGQLRTPRMGKILVSQKFGRPRQSRTAYREAGTAFSRVMLSWYMRARQTAGGNPRARQGMASC